MNMMSRNGRPELVSLLQYMKYTTLENADISVMDKRILHLDSIVEEVKQTEEWEVVKMGTLEIGLGKGRHVTALVLRRRNTRRQKHRLRYCIRDDIMCLL